MAIEIASIRQGDRYVARCRRPHRSRHCYFVYQQVLACCAIENMHASGTQSDLQSTDQGSARGMLSAHVTVLLRTTLPRSYRAAGRASQDRLDEHQPPRFDDEVAPWVSRTKFRGDAQ